MKRAVIKPDSLSGSLISYAILDTMNDAMRSREGECIEQSLEEASSSTEVEDGGSDRKS